MSLVLFTRNLLELGTVTAAAAAVGPTERLYDRDRGLQWQADAVAERTIDLDLGAGNVLQASAWALVNHNLAVTVEVRTSADGVTYGTLVDSANPTGADPFYRTFSPASSRFWRLRIPAGATEARIGELLLGVPITLPTPSAGRGARVRVGNVRTDQSPAGYVWSASRGPGLARRVYGWTVLSAADLDLLEQAFDETAQGAKHFLLRDHLGVLRWARFADTELSARYGEPGDHEVEITLEEAL